MPFTVRVQNFQSIADATIIVDGFTAITGTNNTGKSAFLRAIQGLCRNAKGTRFVRRGETHCTVKITFDDGASVTWEKGEKGINRYQINDDEWMEKVAHGVPPEVEGVLRVHAIAIGGTPYWPQFADLQHGGTVFLLDKPGAVLAEAVSDVERVGRLNKALQVAESDRRKARSVLKVRKQDVESTEQKLEKFLGLDGVGESVRVLEELHTHTARTRVGLLEMLRYQESLQRESGIIQKFSGVESLQLPEETLFTEAADLSALFQSLRATKQELEQSASAVQVLQKAWDAFENADFADSEVESTKKVLQSLQVLQGFHKELSSAGTEVLQLQGELGTLQTELLEAAGELQGILLEMPECPVCGSDTHKGVLHEHG